MSASTAYVGIPIRITVWFRDIDDILVDPDTITYQILESDETTVVSSGTADYLSQGTYCYVWTPGDVGTFFVEFVGSFTDATPAVEIVSQEFEILASDESSQSDSTTLGEDYVFQLVSEFDPLYVSPDELTAVFSDASQLEIAEHIHIHSLEVQDLLGLSDDDVPPYEALDYIIAATACDLSRIYGETDGMSLTGNAVRLGDLSVTSTLGAGLNRQRIDRSTAITWCELAAALRKELMIYFGSKKFLSTVRGSVYKSPIPSRKVRDHETDSEPQYPDQGRLDDYDGPT